MVCLLIFFTQKTHEEYQTDYLTHQTIQVSEGIPHKPSFNVTYPSSLDWRMKGFVTEVSLLAIIFVILMHAMYRSKIKGRAVLHGHLVQQERWKVSSTSPQGNKSV